MWLLPQGSASRNAGHPWSLLTTWLIFSFYARNDHFNINITFSGKYLQSPLSSHWEIIVGSCLPIIQPLNYVNTNRTYISYFYWTFENNFKLRSFQLSKSSELLYDIPREDSRSTTCTCVHNVSKLLKSY